MEKISVNGFLKPKNNSLSSNYLGHFMKISYVHEKEKISVYANNRVNVEENGNFRFFLPSKELISNQSVIINIYAPNGLMLGSQIYSIASLKPEELDSTNEDDTDPLIIKVDPKVIDFNDLSPIINSKYKISGRLVDISGDQKAGGAQLILLGTNDSTAEPGSESYHAVFTAITDKNGYFYGKVENKTYERVIAKLVGLEDETFAINLTDLKIPEDILIVANLSELPASLGKTAGTPNLPDGIDLAQNQAFSQDLGGKCVDFTIPNRTLEEFSFYHTVRTTEPEIKGLTITADETQKIKKELLNVSDVLFTSVGRLKDSLKSLNIIPYTVDEEKTEDSIEITRNAKTSGSIETSIYNAPIYHLKVATGVAQLKMTTKDLTLGRNGIDFASIISILAKQKEREAKLKELHNRLTAAFCGKKGLQDAESFCESLQTTNGLNKQTLGDVLGQLEKYKSFVSKHDELKNVFENYLPDLNSFVKESIIDPGLKKVMETRTLSLISDIELHTNESKGKKELLVDLRSVAKELEKDWASNLSFEPCPPPKQVDSMGIMCLTQEFEKTKKLIRNKSVFTLDEIVTIRSDYDVYITSITSFLSLLDQFYSFYKSGSNLFISVEDDYFIKQFNDIKSSLNSLKRQIFAAIRKLEDIERAYISNHPGRRELTVEHGVDWDETPTIFENTTIAHGHILHFKQVWKADGYSLGDLLYSLPLAPCQEKQIAIIDWDREERAARSEAQTASESIIADISHDRDISEIINSSFTENISASSTNKTKSTSAGIGGGIFGGIGGLFGGVSHSGASSSSTANQKAARNLSGSTLNRLQDNVSQSASSLRTQRSTVIQTVGQNEVMSVQTEVIKNNNHCHAMTVEYFEVLKHYVLEQKLVDVQECLFVPLPMSQFDYPKVLRWRNTLRRFVYGAQLRRGFDAIERITTNYVDSDLPDKSYADEPIENFHGHFTISFDLKRPYISAIDEATKTETIELRTFFPWYMGILKFSLDRQVPLTEAEKDAIFEQEHAPEIVRSFIDNIEVYGIAEDGTEQKLELDLTMLSNYRRNAPLQVSISSLTVPNISRRQIKHLRFRANTSVKAESKIILRSVFLYYQTKHLNEAIIRNSRVNNDIINSVEITFGWPIKKEVATDAALMYAPLSLKEQRNPRKEDREAAKALISFLNEHMEMAHKVIWSSMDASRLFGLLDGYISPNAGGRSVASVTENKIMGFVGNNLVLKVVPGERLDPVFREVQDLLAYYQPTTPPDPFRISVPTKGVYAEAVMGKCNSCEEIDETRHWRFNDVPCGTQPTLIEPVSTVSRKSDIGDLQVKDLPASIINMQSAPAAPDPTGLGSAFNLLGQKGVFTDMTGLAGTQANALEALKTTSKSVTELAGMAADLKKQEAMKKDISKTMEAIDNAEAKKQITKEQANKLRMGALSSLVGEPTKKETTAEKKESSKDVAETAKATNAKKVVVKEGADGSKEVSIETEEKKFSEDEKGLLQALNASDYADFINSFQGEKLHGEVFYFVREFYNAGFESYYSNDAKHLAIESRPFTFQNDRFLLNHIELIKDNGLKVSTIGKIVSRGPGEAISIPDSLQVIQADHKLAFEKLFPGTSTEFIPWNTLLAKKDEVFSLCKQFRDRFITAYNKYLASLS